MKIPLLLAIVLCVYRVAGAQDIPIAPEQMHPWTAPATVLPAAMVSAATELFDDGMADPRGCEYREIEIAKRKDFALKTHGWVLPGPDGQRYAVGWNGLVYPVASVGAPVDLRAEFTALDSANGRRQFPHRFQQVDENISLDPARAQPLQVALLLRLGEASLAEKVWREGAGDSPKAVQNVFADMAHLWLVPWFNRALEAYARDDYPAALALCRQIAPAEKKARESAIQRGTPDPWPDTAEREILWQVPVLEAEAQRRTEEAPYTPVLDSGRPVSGAERVAGLIRDLERVRVHVWSNPGQTNVSEDPVVEALVKEGPTAVEPLLQCLVDDDRLTRTRYGYRLYQGPVIPVYECAYTALFQILQTSFPLDARPGSGLRQSRDIRHLNRADRQGLAAKLAAVWAQQKGRSVLERAYDTLRDDHAGAKAWLQAVDNIVQPGDGLFTEYRLVRPTGAGYGIRVNPAPFTPGGEALRGRSDPSVSDLIVQRFEELRQDDARSGWDLGNPHFFSFEQTLGNLLLSLADWDGKARLDDLRRLQGELVESFRRLTAKPVTREGQGNDRYQGVQVLTRVFEKRQALGDDRALADYADFLQSLTPGSFGTTWGGVTSIFRLMWRHPDDPVIGRTAEKIFGQGSAWVPLVQRDTHDLSALIRSPLVALPAFQCELERGLGDRSAAGQVTLQDNGTLNDGTARLYTLDPLAPPRGSRVAYRLCDRYAHELSLLEGCPEIELYWPEANRDQAVEACRDFLRRYADNFRYREPEDAGRDGSPSGGAAIHFPVLDQPATAEDVRVGRAVFTLPAPARVCRLPGLPLVAYRPGYAVSPSEASDAKGQRVVSYETRGRVWQVEETLVGDRWERFYGFVGRYQLAKVPAAEVEFGFRPRGAWVTPEISASLETPRRLFSGGFRFGGEISNFAAPGAPVPAQVKVCNHSGLDQPLPGEMVLPAGAGRALPPGIRFALSYSEKVPPRGRDYSDPPFDYGAWEKMPLREEVRTVEGNAPEPVLNPGQELTLLDIDLRDYFDLGRVGSYRFQAVFQAPGKPESAADEFIFSVAP